MHRVREHEPHTHTYYVDDALICVAKRTNEHTTTNKHRTMRRAKFLRSTRHRQRLATARCCACCTPGDRVPFASNYVFTVFPCAHHHAAPGTMEQPTTACQRISQLCGAPAAAKCILRGKCVSLIPFRNGCGGGLSCAD